MRKGLVGLRHLMHLITFADRIALPLVSFEDFRRERFLHRHAFAGIRKIHQPAQREGKLERQSELI